ncbi:hypothetical protein J2W22_003801 [Sphingomonas kyeonggiensis]|nr:hypothetical protein [Sphingomonas kyeonggiensis]
MSAEAALGWLGPVGSLGGTIFRRIGSPLIVEAETIAARDERLASG